MDRVEDVTRLRGPAEASTGAKGEQLRTLRRRERIPKQDQSRSRVASAELPHLDKFHPLEPGGRCEVDGLDIAARLRDEGNGAIFVSGHFANWELMPMAMDRYGARGIWRVLQAMVLTVAAVFAFFAYRFVLLPITLYTT